MCGRFGLTDPGRLNASGGLLDAVRPDAVGEDVDALLEPRYNIAPTQPVVVARTRPREQGPERRVDVVRWGLIPSWATDPAIGGRLANARAETVADKPSFRGAWKAGRRCLVFADAFFEWRDVDGAADDPRNGDAPGAPPARAGGRRVARAPKPQRQPYAIRLEDEAPFAFGGLWNVWRDRAAGDEARAAWVPTCTLITTAPNALMARIHDRMPVIVPRAAYDRWLDPELPLDEARALLAPYAPEAMRAYEVSRLVNDPGHDTPDVLRPLAGDGPPSGAPPSGPPPATA